MIASFSAASNITGIMTDTVAVSELCHKYGALSFWDYATAAPYLEINMNASETGLVLIKDLFRSKFTFRSIFCI